MQEKQFIQMAVQRQQIAKACHSLNRYYDLLLKVGEFVEHNYSKPVDGKVCADHGKAGFCISSRSVWEKFRECLRSITQQQTAQAMKKLGASRHVLC